MRLPVPLLHRVLPVASRRLMVIDPGTRFLKVLVVDQTLGRIRVVHRQTIDLEAELNEAESLRERLETMLPDLGVHEVALVLPQHRTIASTFDLPEGGEPELRQTLEAEARKLSGLGEESMLHAGVRLRPFGRFRRPCLLSLCKREEVSLLLERFTSTADPVSGDPIEDTLIGLTTAAPALFAAIQAVDSPPATAVVVDLGAENTVVGILLDGQGVFATSFDGGSHDVTRVVAERRGCTLAEAEVLKHVEDLLGGDTGLEPCRKAVERWYSELRRAVTEWLEDFPELGLSLGTLPVYVCGGGARQAGLIEYLNRLGGLTFHPWPATRHVDPDWPMEQYWVAYGAACLALAPTSAAVSFLPVASRQARQRRRFWEWIQAANLFLLGFTALLLAAGTWQKGTWLQRKQALITQTTNALVAVRSIDQISRRLGAGYDVIRPVLQRQHQTLETLRCLTAIRSVRTNDDYWLVLFADAASYAAGTTAPVASTNMTNQASLFQPVDLPATKREFIAEVCIPQEGDAARRILSHVVGELKKQPLFSRVDALPPERKRSWVDPKVAISNRVFAISMELTERDMAPGPARPARPATNGRDSRTGAAPPR